MTEQAKSSKIITINVRGTEILVSPEELAHFPIFKSLDGKRDTVYMLHNPKTVYDVLDFIGDIPVEMTPKLIVALKTLGIEPYAHLGDTFDRLWVFQNGRETISWGDLTTASKIHVIIEVLNGLSKSGLHYMNGSNSHIYVENCELNAIKYAVKMANYYKCTHVQYVYYIGNLSAPECEFMFANLTLQRRIRF